MSKRLSIQSGHPVTCDVAAVPGRFVRFVTEDGRCMFEVGADDSGRGIEVRGVEVCKVGGVVYSESLSVEPNSSNGVTIRTKEYGT